jgi:hypothetical protein
MTDSDSDVEILVLDCSVPSRLENIPLENGINLVSPVVDTQQADSSVPIGNGENVVGAVVDTQEADSSYFPGNGIAVVNSFARELPPCQTNANKRPKRHRTRPARIRKDIKTY